MRHDRSSIAELIRRGVQGAAMAVCEVEVLESLWFGEDDPRLPQELAQRSMAAALATSLALKPFPQAASQALVLLDAPGFDVRRLARCLGADPGLLTRLLSLANSSIYGSRLVESVRDAVVRLGAAQVREVVVQAALFGMFDDVAGRPILEHSVGVVAVLKGVLRWRAFPGLPPVVLAGVLHDVGKLLLLQSGEGTPALHLCGDPPALAERLALGFDHAVLGAHAVRAWRIPEPTAQVIAAHHQPSRVLAEGGMLAVMVALLRLANRLEPLLASQEDLDQSELEALCERPELCYLDYTPDALQRLWDDLADHRVSSRLPGRNFGWAA